MLMTPTARKVSLGCRQGELTHPNPGGLHREKREAHEHIDGPRAGKESSLVHGQIGNYWWMGNAAEHPLDAGLVASVRASAGNDRRD